VRRPAILLALLALAALPAARSAGASDRELEPLLGPLCLVGYAMRTTIPSPYFSIPDDNQTDALVGILPTVADGGTLPDIILEVDMDHTSIGDLVVKLDYVDCESGAVLSGTTILCRPRGDDPDDNAPCGDGTGSGCSGNLGKSYLDEPEPSPARYFFTDEASAPMADGSCPRLVPTGCYQPSPGGSTRAFAGLPRGGCWRLFASDWTLGHTGAITSWGIWERDLSTGARRHTWGELKTIYR